MFSKFTDAQVLNMLAKQFAIIADVAVMSKIEQKSNAGKQSPPIESVFVNVIFFNKAFAEGRTRGILSPVEIACAEMIHNNTF